MSCTTVFLSTCQEKFDKCQLFLALCPPPLFHSFFVSALGPCILLNEIDTCRRGQLGWNNAIEPRMVISWGHSGILWMPLHNLNRQFESPGEIKTFPNACEDGCNSYSREAFPYGLHGVYFTFCIYKSTLGCTVSLKEKERLASTEVMES